MRTGKQRMLSLVLAVIFLIGAAAIPAAASGTNDKSEATEQTSSSVSAADAGKTEEQVKADHEEGKTADAANTAVGSASVSEPEEETKTEADKPEKSTETAAAEKTEIDKAGTSDNKNTGSAAGNSSSAGSVTGKADTTDTAKDQPAAVSKSGSGTEPEPEKKPLDEMTDEEILIAGESLLKTAIAEADKRRGDLDIIFNGEDLALYIRYQEVKRKAQASSSGRKMLRAAAAQAEIKHIYAKDYGPLIQMASAVTQEFPYMRPVGTHVHYDAETNNAVYCANINRHFVSDTIYEVAGQWKDDEMYSALSYVFDKGVKKLNGTAKKKYSTGDATRDWYATQMAVWGILHHFGIKDAKGWDAGFDMNQTQAIGGYENVYNMMHKLYDDALYYASKKNDGSASDPYFVMENPDYKLILQGKTDVPFYITSAEEPVYTLDIKGSSNASEASVVLRKKDYDDSQRWRLESTGEAGYYFIKNEQSGKYLETDGTGNNDDIQQNTKDGTDKQKWNMIAASDGTVQFAPKAAPGKRIDIKNGVFVNGTNVQCH
ncbi:MAG: RICIN domain-containing protein [Eubacterium sp.]|nr:RICIN domain-containing protein [Eubacterium sp.]